MSNYILYNFEDEPDDFYERLRINIELNEEFNNTPTRTSIYSFPMRYIPLKAKNRDADTGDQYWNNKFLRSVQVILNVMKGPVMPGKQFFLQAFGRDKGEFKAILSMPEEFIRNRLLSNWRDIDTIEGRWMPYVRDWMNEFNQLSSAEKELLVSAIATCDKKNIENQYAKASNGVKKLLEYHLKENKIVATAQIPTGK